MSSQSSSFFGKPFPFFWGEGKEDELCLSKHPQFLPDAPTCSRFLPSGRFGQYRQFESEEKKLDFILSKTENDRTFCTVVFPKQPLYFYADLDRKRLSDEESGETLATITSKMHAALRFVESIFTKTYPGHSLHIENMWTFEAVSPTKWSFHIHADPWAEAALWANVDELSWFMKKVVKPAIEAAFEDDDPDVLIFCNKQNQDDPIDTFLDFAVYGKMQNVKLPLNCKPGKTTMNLYQYPSYAQRHTCDRRQLMVGRIVAIPGATTATQALPLLFESEEVKQTKASRKRNATAISVDSIVVINETDPVRSIVIEIAKQELGTSVNLYNLSITETRIKGSFSAGTAMCPFQKRVHNGNRIYMSGSSQLPHLEFRCFDETCKGMFHVAKLTNQQMFVLFPSYFL